MAHTVKGGGEVGEEKGFDEGSLAKFGRDDEFFVIAIVATAITIDVCLLFLLVPIPFQMFQFVNLSKTTKEPNVSIVCWNFTTQVILTHYAVTVAMSDLK